MIKALTSLAAFAAAGAVASAQPLPAPPTVKYTPAAASTCDASAFQVYFSKGESRMTAESMKVLKAARADLSGCVLGPVSLRADVKDAASAEAAEQLAEARIAAVSTALEAHDLAGTHIDARFDPAPTAAMPQPMGRAVEVQLSAWAPQIG
ncbi:MAG: hypothetical protein AAGK93_10745 [Pseudomonadota bacterium]